MEKRRLWSPPEIKAALRSSFRKLKPTLNYFWFHFFFFVFVSLFLGVLFWSIETDLNFMDALFLATSTFCNVGLVTVDFSNSTLTTQIFVYIFLHFGGFILISVIPLLVRVASLLKHPSRPTPYPRKPYIRGLLLLVGFILSYLIVIELVFFLVMGIYLTSHTHHNKTLKKSGVNPWWWALFHSASAFQNTGLSLLPNSMIPFATDPVITLSLAFLIFAGYTGYPILLRAILWIAKTLLRKGPNYEALCLIFSNPRYFYFLLFPLRETLVLLGSWALITIVEFFIFFIEWNDILKPFSTSHKLLVNFFQTISVRICGFNNIDIGELTTGHLVTYIFTMYISAYPFIVTIRGTRQNAEKETSVRKQTLKVLGRDLFWLYFGVLLLCLIEEERKSNSKVPNPFLRIVFEVVSAFGNVGLSTGFLHHSYSYSGSFFSFSKFIIIVIMLCGRHRGLPNSIDPAITPTERKTFEMDIELPTINPSKNGISSTPIEDVSETTSAAATSSSSSSSSSSSFRQPSKLSEGEQQVEEDKSEGSQGTRRPEEQQPEEEEDQQEHEEV